MTTQTGIASASHAPDAEIEGMLSVILSEAAPERVFLFGSRARGNARSNSDIDLMVVVKGPLTQERSRRKLLTALARSLGKFKTPHDVLLFTEEEVEAKKDYVNHVIARVLSEGKVLYDRREI